MVKPRLSRSFALPELPLRGKKKREYRKWEGEAPAEPRQQRKSPTPKNVNITNGNLGAPHVIRV